MASFLLRAALTGFALWVVTQLVHGISFVGGNTTGFLGFSFINANTSTVNYGYAKFTTTAGTGYPATIVEYWYDNSGAAINIP